MGSLEVEYITRSTETTLDIATEVVSLLKAHHQTVSVAESLTGGGFMAALTSIPGSSSVFRGGIVSYATALKQHILQVDANLIAAEGVIHADVAAQMADGARKATACGERETDWGVGTTGVAGPDKQDEKPVGTVYIGIASKHGRKGWGPFSFPGPRERVRETTIMEALARLRDAVKESVEEEPMDEIA